MKLSRITKKNRRVDKTRGKGDNIIDNTKKYEGSP